MFEAKIVLCAALILVLLVAGVMFYAQPRATSTVSNSESFCTLRPQDYALGVGPVSEEVAIALERSNAGNVRVNEGG